MARYLSHRNEAPFPLLGMVEARESSMVQRPRVGANDEPLASQGNAASSIVKIKFTVIFAISFQKSNKPCKMQFFSFIDIDGLLCLCVSGVAKIKLYGVRGGKNKLQNCESGRNRNKIEKINWK